MRANSQLGKRTEEIGVGHPAQVRLVGHGDDVVASAPKTLGYLAADLLVQEKLQPKAACSRFQAASASSASSVLRAIRRSISSPKLA